jgi:hypothetical protein
MIGAYGIGTISRSNVVTSPGSGKRESFTRERIEEVVRGVAKHVNDGMTVAQASRIVFGDGRNFYYVLSKSEEHKRLYYRLVNGRGNPGQRTLTNTERMARVKAYWDLRDAAVNKATAEKQVKIWASDIPNWRKDDAINAYWEEREARWNGMKERINGIRREKKQASTQDTAASGAPSIHVIKPTVVQDGSIASVLPALRAGKAIRRSDSYTCYAMCDGRMTEYKVILGRRQHVGLAYIIGADLLATDWEVMP